MRFWPMGLTVALALSAWRWQAALHPQQIPKLSRLPEFSAEQILEKGTAPFSRKNLEGRVWVAGLMFARCSGPCPALSARMASLAKTLPAEVGLVSFTVDPEADDAPELRRYAQSYGADFKRWLFLRPLKKDVYRIVYEGLRQEVANNPAPQAGQNVLHSLRLSLIDRDGWVRGSYDSSRESFPEILRADALRVLEEKKI